MTTNLLLWYGKYWKIKVYRQLRNDLMETAAPPETMEGVAASPVAGQGARGKAASATTMVAMTMARRVEQVWAGEGMTKASEVR